MTIMIPQADEEGVRTSREAMERRLGRPVTEDEAKRALQWYINWVYLNRLAAEQYEAAMNPPPKPRRRRRRNGILVTPRGPRRGAAP